MTLTLLTPTQLKVSVTKGISDKTWDGRNSSGKDVSVTAEFTFTVTQPMTPEELPSLSEPLRKQVIKPFLSGLMKDKEEK